MKLSDQIGNHADEEIGYSTAVVARSRLYNWQEAAQRIERSQRDAWRSFWVAAAVVAVLIVFAVWQRFDLAPPAPAQGVKSSPVMYA